MSAINVDIKLFDKSLPFPKKHSKGAACFDGYSRTNIDIEANSIGYIPLNIAISVPEGYWTMLAARSSLHKKGLWLANGIGVVDSDYSGDDDEVMAAVYNFTNETVHVEKATRVVQLMVLPVQAISLNQVDKMTSKSRGAFGTTGD